MVKKRLVAIKQKLFPELFSSSDMLYLLHSSGIKVGKGTIFYHPGRTVIDRSRPCLLEIGEYCKITSGVVILTHDYSRSVLRRTHGEILGEAKKTTIGDNVFIGMNSIILMGSEIGSNVIIGAGSVVSGKIPDNVVVAGNPAKIIRTLDEHYRIRKGKVKEEAVYYARCFYREYNRWPTIKEMDPFYPLFLPRDESVLKASGVNTALGGDDQSDVIRCFMDSQPEFDGYDAFISYCEEGIEC